MEFKKGKQVRFHNDGNQNLEKPSVLYKVSAPLSKPDSGIDEKTRTKGSFEFGGFKVFPENHHKKSWREKIIDPGSEVFLQWNRIFLFSCLVALFVDPLTIADIFYSLHVFIKFRTAYVSPSSRVFGRGELVMDPKKISRRYLKSDFFIDVIATLPLPQIVRWFIIPAIRSSDADHTNNALALIVLFQYIPRLYLIFPLSSQIIKATGVVAKTAWAGAAYNLLLYMLASHILGASWYLLSIERYATCWKSVCKHEISPIRCSPHFLDCGTLNNMDRISWANSTAVFSSCNPANTISFNYGIFQNAVTNNVVNSKFLEKYFYCLWWGLQNLSRAVVLTFIKGWEFELPFLWPDFVYKYIYWRNCICDTHSHLGSGFVCPFDRKHAATYLQSLTMRLEEWRLKQRDTEEWMRHRQLPQDLQERVRHFGQYKWLATRGVDEESILQALPTDLRKDIQRHLCVDLVRRVPFFSQMEDQLLDAICKHLVSSLSTQGTYIVREGDPVTEMLFIIRGRLESSTTNGGRTGFFNSITLRPGDFCGEELLAWALLPKSTVNLPSSTRTVRALVEVEAFALQAEDLKFVANQFRRLHSKQLQHTFRFYSYHWRTWAACFIQAAWHRFKRRLMAKNLSMRESFSFASDERLADETEREDEEKDDNAPSSSSTTSSQAKQNLGVTILASRFAANTRRGIQKMKDVELPKLQKPEEPDFSAEPDDD
ncbi:unnamed protein product [Camellia sinensis]